MKKFYVCKQCGSVYTSKKKNSEFCSLECKHKYHRYIYNCDNCGKEIMIYKNEYDKLQSGQKKHKYCSKECQIQGSITSSYNQCKNCGELFPVFQCVKDTNNFCSKACYREYSNSHSYKAIERICPVCNNSFYSEKKEFCSIACSNKSHQQREICSCLYCGKEFERIISEINKNTKHYCSQTCKKLDQKWSDKDIKTLVDNYNKIKTKDIIPLLSKPYTDKAIRAEAGRQDLYKSRLWSEEEIQILIQLYSTVPMEQVMKALPNRTIASITGKTRVLGLKSWFYLHNIYSDEEIDYIKSNYLSMTNTEISEHINRSPASIGQRLLILGLHRPFDLKSACYTSLADYIRGQNASWRNHVFMQNHYLCCLTGRHDNLVVHHCRSFNLLLQEAIDNSGFEIKDSFSEYSTHELSSFYDYFYELQDSYGEYVCIHKDIHTIFHKQYGYGNNTMDQWNEFKIDYLNGKYNKIA